MVLKRYTDLFGLLSLLLLPLAHAVAQNAISFSADAPGRAGLNDQINVTYTIRNADNMRTLVPGGFSDFQILAGPFQSQSSSISVASNGRQVQSTSITLTYVLRARHTGTFNISPATAKDVAGHTFQSNALTIQVVPGSVDEQKARRRQANPLGDDPFSSNDPFAAFHQQQQMARQMMQQRRNAQPQQSNPGKQTAGSQEPADVSKDLFIRVSVDKTKVALGEQVTASYRLYARIPMQVAISKLPSLNGFWTQDFDIPRDPKPTEEIVDGKKYQVFLLKKSALFPQQTGTLHLDPAEAQGTARVIQQMRQRNPFADMFDNDPAFQQAFGGSLMMNDPFFRDNFFSSYSYRDVQVHLKSVPVNITVTELPEKDKPAGFTGAVGNFTMTGKVDKTNITTDDVMTFHLTINGSGNLKLFEAPKLDLPNGLSAYDPMVIDTITGRSTTITGSKQITYNIAASIPGDYTFPGVNFSYYDPKTGSYHTITTEPSQLHVTAGKHYHPKNNIAAGKPKGDINNIVTDIPTGTASESSLLTKPVYWSIYALPMLAFIGMAVRRRRKDELANDLAVNRHRYANKIALKRLATAAQFLKEQKQTPFYEEISKAVWLYLSDKLRIPLSGLSKEAAFAVLDNHLGAESKKDLEILLNDCEMALYAPSQFSSRMNETYGAAVAAISRIEGEYHT